MSDELQPSLLCQGTRYRSGVAAVNQELIDLIWERAGGLCENIVNGKRCYSNQMLTIHHLTIKGMGGRKNADREDNLILLCYRCHAAKHGERVVL